MAKGSGSQGASIMNHVPLALAELEPALRERLTIAHQAQASACAVKKTSFVDLPSPATPQLPAARRRK